MDYDWTTYGRSSTKGNLWFLSLLGIVFRFSSGLMLFYDAITVRDILYVRMGMFSSSSILSILSDTLILRFKGFV